ncbi:MAG: type II toxin-antitoxin system ParD family antitoxin [Alphaproteobacteria bacterium]|nr:type II toxin-antitoxin system ParD family antitoxin [Alphaproteobacteria bacterium]
MTTMNISLPSALRDFVEAQVEQGGYSSSSEYVRELIREDRKQAELRAALLEGAASPPVGVADKEFFDGLRERIRR